MTCMSYWNWKLKNTHYLSVAGRHLAIAAAIEQETVLTNTDGSVCFAANVIEIRETLKHILRNTSCLYLTFEGGSGKGAILVLQQVYRTQRPHVELTLISCRPIGGLKRGCSHFAASDTSYTRVLYKVPHRSRY